MPEKQWSLERLRAESGTWRSAILITAVHLDLFTWLGKRARSLAALAARFGGNPDGWEIFLNALCAMGLLRKRRQKYANSRFSSKHLSGDGAAFLLPAYDAWQAWGGLAAVLRSGRRPKTEKPFFSDAKKTYRLLRALEVDARAIAPHLIARLPLSRAGTLLDLGGGLGAFSAAFCRRYPRLRATVVEHPRIARIARRAVGRAGPTKRIRVIGLDFRRRALPRGFDTVFVSNVLHSYGVDENRSLLVKIRNCLNPEGQLILRDVFMNRDKTGPEWATLFSVSLLLHTPRGRCYTIDEIVGWLRQSGFSRITGPFRSSPLSFDPDSVLIART
jgi:3-hydroxy-5-methyl-1-naphthoate 3-O-methyltransferase